MAEKILLNLDKKLKKLIPGFIENRHREIKQIELAIKNNQFKDLTSIGHQLTGSRWRGEKSSKGTACCRQNK